VVVSGSDQFGDTSNTGIPVAITTGVPAVPEGVLVMLIAVLAEAAP
jgi:hypothetical protein